MGNFHVAKFKTPKAGPGLVYIQGGTFIMGSKEIDVMGDWNNAPKKVKVRSFFIDETEVANVHYREYLHWLETAFSGDAAIIEKATPDTLCWRDALAYNEPYVEYYFRHPAYNFYPVVGVSWLQAKDFCVWRTDRVNEKKLESKGYLQKKTVANQKKNKEANGTFNTESYLNDPSEILNKSTPKKSTLQDINGKPRAVKTEDGILNPSYRLPTEAEWEYAAYGLKTPLPIRHKKHNKSKDAPVETELQVYSWSKNPQGMRDTKIEHMQGAFLANFKQHSGDNMGVVGGLNDRSVICATVKSFYPNDFGLYNMCGNVNEWVADIYRPTLLADISDKDNPFRGNDFRKFYKNANGNYERDSVGHLKKEDENKIIKVSQGPEKKTTETNVLAEDSASHSFYETGVTTLIGKKSRVYKGGGWNDRPYWLSPGTRRFLDEDLSSNSIGFRCAQASLSAEAAPDFKEGNLFAPTKKSKHKKHRL